MSKPTYILKANTLRKNLLKFNEIFSAVYYPVKSNNNKMLLDFFNKNNSSFEVETIIHLQNLIDVGVPPQKILFYSPFSNERDIDFAINYGIRFFVATNLKTIQILESKGIEYDFLVRLQEIVESPSRKKFGAPESEIHTMLSHVQNGHFCGVSFYLNAEINTIENLKKMIDYSGKILNSNKSSKKIIDVGGGISLEKCRILESFFKSKSDYDLIIEPGKDMINPAIDLVTTVLAIDKDASVIYLNAGIYSGLLDSIVKKRVFQIEASKSTQKIVNYLISGPTADLSDVIGYYDLPELEVGDNLIFKNCGAYSEVLCTSFYGFNGSEMIIDECDYCD